MEDWQPDPVTRRVRGGQYFLCEGRVGMFTIIKQGFLKN